MCELPDKKTVNDFGVIMYKPIGNNTITWEHPTHNATMLINKNGIILELNEEEIKQVVRVAGGNF